MTVLIYILPCCWSLGAFGDMGDVGYLCNSYVHVYMTLCMWLRQSAELRNLPLELQQNSLKTFSLVCRAK